MRNFWLVARYEYRRMVFRRAFVLLTLAIPLGMALLIALAIFVALTGENSSPVGFRDEAGMIATELYDNEADSEDRLTMIGYADLEGGLAALEREEIQAFFVLPAGYPQNGSIDLYYLTEHPGDAVWSDFRELVRLNLLAQYPQETAQRLHEGAAVTVFDVASQRTFSSAAIINIILPFVASFLFFVATMSASGYMLQVVADEKESRTMEIMLTSVSPGQLIAGKMIGLLLAALTQLGIYVGAGIICLVIATPYVPGLQLLTIPWLYLGIMISFFIPAYVLIAAMMVAIGGAVTELQQGQQIAGILNIFFILPILLLVTVFENASAPILIFLSFFPTSSFLTISLRWGVSTVPYWQISLSWLILVASALFMMWAAVRIFNLGMLRYGQSLRLKTVLAALFGKARTSRQSEQARLKNA